MLKSHYGVSVTLSKIADRDILFGYCCRLRMEREIELDRVRTRCSKDIFVSCRQPSVPSRTLPDSNRALLSLGNSLDREIRSPMVGG